MKFRFKGDLDSITIRGVTFPKDKAVSVDCPDLAAKIDVLPYFTRARERKANAKDKT